MHYIRQGYKIQASLNVLQVPVCLNFLRLHILLWLLASNHTGLPSVHGNSQNSTFLTNTQLTTHCSPTRYEIHCLTPHFDFHFLKAVLHDQSIQNSSFSFFLTVPHYFLSFIIGICFLTWLVSPATDIRFGECQDYNASFPIIQPASYDVVATYLRNIY